MDHRTICCIVKGKGSCMLRYPLLLYFEYKAATFLQLAIPASSWGEKSPLCHVGGILKQWPRALSSQECLSKVAAPPQTEMSRKRNKQGFVVTFLEVCRVIC